MKPLSIRDAFWLAVLCLVLAVWGWDRGRLATRVESLAAPQMMPAVGGMGSGAAQGQGAGAFSFQFGLFR